MKTVTRTLAAIAAVATLAAVPLEAAASTAPAKSYALGHAKYCRTDYVKRTARHVVDVRVRVHERLRGKVIVRVKLERKSERYVACEYVASVVTTTAAKPTTTIATSAPTSQQTVRAAIDPSYTQNSSNPLEVTWSYSAGITDGTLPDGTLAITVYVHSAVSSAGGCTMNVGGNVSGGTCAVTLPAYGLYDVTVVYSGAASISSTAATDTEDVENPSPTTTTTTLPPSTSTAEGLSIISGAPYFVPGDIYNAEEEITASVVDQNGQAVIGAVTFMVTDQTSGVVWFTASSTSGSCDFDYHNSPIPGDQAGVANFSGCTLPNGATVVGLATGGDTYVVTTSYAGSPSSTSSALVLRTS